MTISGNYSSPVQVNGFSCRNCTDVEYAKKHIDPAHPRSGPYDVNAQDDPSRALSDAVEFGGNLSGRNASSSSGGTHSARAGYAADAQSISAPADPGQLVDATV